ncbi:Hypothetical predicted protein [Mytilus galloprovincialis]|uniref:Uncharacterized protein n=1 Tax=Mytilus galloprovincialis TaxID=29158 RepID=A0A8B6D6G6_MYTGA|nr:Hypothetical predicted protein [Mytilus galloprovincialis]
MPRRRNEYRQRLRPRVNDVQQPAPDKEHAPEEEPVPEEVVQVVNRGRRGNRRRAAPEHQQPDQPVEPINQPPPQKQLKTTAVAGLEHQWIMVTKLKELKVQTSLRPLQTRMTTSKLESSPSAQYTGQAQKCLYGSPYTASPQTSRMTKKEYKVYQPMTKLFEDSIFCIGNSREDRTNLQHASSTSGLWSPVAKGQTLQTLQTRKSSPTLKTPTKKRPSIQLELSPSEQYTSTTGLWSPVAKGQTLQTLQTRKSSPTLKTPTRKRPSIQLELSPSEQYTRVTKIRSPIDCISPQSKNQSLHLVWPPQDQYTFADDKAVTTSSNHSVSKTINFNKMLFI